MTIWRFATRFYTVDGVASALLTLQDRDGADALVILTLMHLARRGRRLGAGAVARIDAAAAPCRAIIEPLRAARRAVPREEATLRARMKAAELLAERRHLLHLARIAAAEPFDRCPCDEAARHLAYYLPDSRECRTLLGAFTTFA